MHFTGWMLISWFALEFLRWDIPLVSDTPNLDSEKSYISEIKIWLLKKSVIYISMSNGCAYFVSAMDYKNKIERTIISTITEKFCFINNSNCFINFSSPAAFLDLWWDYKIDKGFEVCYDCIFYHLCPKIMIYHKPTIISYRCHYF